MITQEQVHTVTEQMVALQHQKSLLEQKLREVRLYTMHEGGSRISGDWF